MLLRREEEMASETRTYTGGIGCLSSGDTGAAYHDWLATPAAVSGIIALAQKQRIY